MFHRHSPYRSVSKFFNSLSDGQISLARLSVQHPRHRFDLHVAEEKV